MSKSFYHKITDEQWKIIEPHLPKPKSTGRPALNFRTVFNAIFWVLDSGAKWRYLPKEYGNWNSICFVSGASWEFLKKFCSLWLKMDSTFCKVHQYATGARKILGIQDIVVSRGGKTTKIHALVNEHFQLVSVELSGGNIHDSEMAIKVLSKVTLEGKKILADKAFCSEEIRNFISQEKAGVCIPDKSNAVVIHEFDEELYKARNIIERFFQHRKNFRDIATRYDKLSECFLKFVLLAAVMIKI